MLKKDVLMKEIPPMVVCVALSAALWPGIVSAQNQMDFGFEETIRNVAPRRWTANTIYPFESVASVVKDLRYVRSGNASVKLVKKEDPANPAAMGQLYTRSDIAIEAGGRYLLTFWARGQGRIVGRTYRYGPNAQGTLTGKADKNNPEKGVVSDADWRCFKYEFVIPDAPQKITSVRLVIVAVGTVYVDDLTWTALTRTQDRSKPKPSPKPTSDAPRRNLLTVPQSATAPVVDGKFEDNEYAVGGTGLMNCATSDLYAYAARYGLSRDADRFHFALAIDLPGNYVLRTSSRQRDDEGLIATQDVFYMMFRPDDDAESSTFEGAYLAVTSNGTIYDAWEQISWSQSNCRRDASFNADWKIATRTAKGRWTVELSVPFADLKLNPNADATHLLSFGMNLDAYAVSWQLRPIWFDHSQAFGRLRFVKNALTVSTPDVGALARGEAKPTFAISNPGSGKSSYEIMYIISTPKMVGGRIGSYIFDQPLDIRQKEAVRGRSVFYWNRTGELATGQTALERSAGHLDTPGAYVLEAEVRSGDQAVLYQKAPFRFVPPVTVSLIPIPSKDQIVAAISVRGAKPEEKGQVKLTFKGVGKATALVHAQTIQADEVSPTISMAKLAPGDHDVVAELTAKDGHVAATTSTTFTKWDTPVWLEERVGLDALNADWVPDPWTPVAVGESSVDVWGRRFDFAADSVIAKITSQNTPLLAGGIAIHYEASDKRHTVALEAPKLSSLGKGRAKAEQRGTSRHFDLHVIQQIEFDGMDRIDLRLSPRKPVDVRRVWIEIPFRKLPYSILTSCDSSNYWQRGLVSDALFTKPRALGKVWLGDDDVGCAFFVENYKGWVVNSTQPRITLTSDDDSRRMNLLLVNDPSRVAEPIAVVFGLHPTPFKPLFAGWRDLRPQGLQIDPPPVNAAFVHAGIWNSCDAKPSPRNWQVLKDIVAFAHGRKQKVYPYLGTFLLSPYDNVKRDTPFDPNRKRYAENQLLRRRADATRQEEYFYFAEDWHRRPPRIVESRQETRQQVYTAAGSSWADYFVHGVAEMLKRTAVDGFYLDIANPGYDMNPDRGLTVVTKDGKHEGSRELFATRDLYKRLYRVFEQHRGAERRPWLFGHGLAVSVPYSSFWDASFSCEAVKPDRPFGFTAMSLQKSLEGAPMARQVDTADARDFNAFAHRAHFASDFGMPKLVLPQYGYRADLRTVAHSREMLSWTFLHNNLLWPAWIPYREVYDFWSKVEIPFGMGDTVCHPYWKNGIGTGSQAAKLSYWKKDDTDDYLVAIANWSGKPVTAKVELPPFLARFGTCLDMEKGETIKVNDNWPVEMPPHDLRVFRFSFGK